MSVFMKRNIKLFFRDKSAVFFSLLAVLIIIVLYAVFLGDVWLDGSMQGLDGADALLSYWLSAGILAVASATTAMGAFGVMVDDKVRKINKDFYSSPVKRSAITGGYIGSAYFIGVIMSVVTVFAAQLYIIINGGEWFSPVIYAKILLLTLFTTLTNTSMICFMVSFFKSHSAYSAASTIIGTLIGFLTGIYLPVGALPETVQTVIKAFPISHAAYLYRCVLMEDTMSKVFNGVPVEYLNEFKEYMGIVYRFGDYEVTPVISILYLVITAAAFYGLSLLNMSKK